MANVAAVQGLVECLTVFERILFHTYNFFGNKESYKLIVLGSDAYRFEFLWGLIKFQKGSQLEISVFCTEKAFSLLEDSLKRNSDTAISRLSLGTW